MGVDIVGKNHKNTERIEMRMKERQARLLARSEMEKKRLAHTLKARAKTHSLARKQIQTKAIDKSQSQKSVKSARSYDLAEQMPVAPHVSAKDSRTAPAIKKESYFDLSSGSSLQDYMRSLRVSVQEQGGAIFTGRSHTEPKEGTQSDAQAIPARKKVSIVRSALGTGFLLILGLGLLVFTSLTVFDIGFWLFFFALLIWRIDSRLSIALALVCLVGIPFLLVSARAGFDRGDAWAEIVAVWAYLFLVIGVAVQIWEYVTRKS